MKKYDIEKIKEKIEKYKDCNLNTINPDDIPELKDIKIYSCKLTCDVIRRNFKDEGIEFNNLYEIEPHKKLNFGKNFFRM